MADFTKNYKTKNAMKGAESKDWSITGAFKKSIAQADVQLKGGKEYQYASRWPVSEGDVVIIGNKMPKDFIGVEQSSNFGQMGIVTNVWPKLAINRNHAVELDFVFSPEASKKMIKDCIKYMDMPVDSNNFQYGSMQPCIFPTTFLVRKLITASSIVAHPDMAGTDAVAKAIAYISTAQDVNAIIRSADAGAPGAWLECSLADTHVFGPEVENMIEIKDQDKGIPDEIAAAINKYAYMGAISIMVRGGFVNMLEAFLSAEPPIKDFYEEMIGYLGDTGNAKALEMINNYKLR